MFLKESYKRQQSADNSLVKNARDLHEKGCSDFRLNSILNHELSTILSNSLCLYIKHARLQVGQ